MRDALVHAAERDLFHPNQVIASVEQHDTQRFLVQGSHFCGHQIVDEFGRIEFLPRQTFIRESPAQIEGGYELNCFRLADTRNGFDLPHRAAAQTRERTVPLQKLPRDFHRVRARQTCPQQDRDQFRIDQSRGAVREKFFARPLTLRHLADF